MIELWNQEKNDFNLIFNNFVNHNYEILSHSNDRQSHKCETKSHNCVISKIVVVFVFYDLLSSF